MLLLSLLRRAEDESKLDHSNFLFLPLDRESARARTQTGEWRLNRYKKGIWHPRRSSTLARAGVAEAGADKAALPLPDAGIFDLADSRGVEVGRLPGGRECGATVREISLE